MNALVPRPAHQTLARVIGLILAGLAIVNVGVGADGTQGPMASADGQLQGATLFLELVINDMPTGRVVSVEYRQGRYYLSAHDLQALSFPVEYPAADQIPTDVLPNVRTEYDSHQQQLKLTVPAAWLPSQALGSGRSTNRVPAVSTLGAAFNYDIYASSAADTGTASVWSEQRLFDDWGMVSTSGVYQQRFGHRPGAGDRRYLRYDTMWSYSDEERALTFTAGDLVTSALPWGSAVRLGGISLARNFRVRPDIITYPLPEFAGQATVPTAVELFINGSKTLSGTVPPGPFVVSDVPLMTGAGTATVVTTDAQGRRISTNISFYIANTLLRKGMVDYAVSAGLTRREFGLRSFAYGKPAGVAVLRYGLTNFLTLDGHVEAGERLLTTSLGADVRVGQFGVLTAAAAFGDGMRSRARQYSADYSYTGRRYSLVLRHLQRGSEFRDLAQYDSDSPLSSVGLARQVDQVTGAVTLPKIGGTASLGVFSVLARDQTRTRVGSATYTRAFVGRSTLTVSVNRRSMQNRPWGAQAQLTVPLGGWGSATLSAARSDAAQAQSGVHYSRSVPSDGGLGWNASYATGERQDKSAGITWRTSTFQAHGGAYEVGNQRLGWAGLSGAAIVMNGGVFPSNRVTDAFVLVDTAGHPDVPVLFENQVVGRTNRRGQFLVPWVSSYHTAKYEIDPLQLPGNVRVPVVEQRVAVRRNSGTVLRFPVETMVAATIRLVDADGVALPLGLEVTHQESGQKALVGWDGIVYFEALQASNVLRVALPEGSCQVSFPLENRRSQLARIGPLACR